MSQFVEKLTKTYHESKRHFTVVMGGKENGLYVSSTPSSAAKKAVTKLCTANKSKKVEFSIREITQGSKKKTYGPYTGHIEKLKEPIELKGRVFRYKPVAKLNKKKVVQKGGEIYTGKFEIIFKGPQDFLKIIIDEYLIKIFKEYCKIQITRKKGKIIIELINFSEEKLVYLSDIKFFDSIFDIISEDSDYEIINLHFIENPIKIYLKEYFYSNNSKTSINYNERILFDYVRIAFCCYDRFDKAVQHSCNDQFKENFFNSDWFYNWGIEYFNQYLGDYTSYKNKIKYIVFQGYTSFDYEKDLKKKLSALNNLECLRRLRESNKEFFDEILEGAAKDESYCHFIAHLYETWGNFEPKIIDKEGNILMKV